MLNVDEIKEAIEKRRFPLNNANKLLAVFLAGFGTLTTYFEVEVFLKDGWPGAIGMFLPFVALPAFICWNWWNTKKLLPYLNHIPYDKKTEVLEALLKDLKVKRETNIYWADRNKPLLYYSFACYEDFLTTYMITIFYDESGYYVNSLTWKGRIQVFSTQNANLIIDKIKALEAGRPEK